MHPRVSDACLCVCCCGVRVAPTSCRTLPRLPPLPPASRPEVRTVVQIRPETLNTLNKGNTAKNKPYDKGYDGTVCLLDSPGFRVYAQVSVGEALPGRYLLLWRKPNKSVDEPHFKVCSNSKIDYNLAIWADTSSCDVHNWRADVLPPDAATQVQPKWHELKLTLGDKVVLEQGPTPSKEQVFRWRYEIKKIKMQEKNAAKKHSSGSVPITPKRRGTKRAKPEPPSATEEVSDHLSEVSEVSSEVGSDMSGAPVAEELAITHATLNVVNELLAALKSEPPPHSKTAMLTKQLESQVEAAALSNPALSMGMSSPLGLPFWNLTNAAMRAQVQAQRTRTLGSPLGGLTVKLPENADAATAATAQSAAGAAVQLPSVQLPVAPQFPNATQLQSAVAADEAANKMALVGSTNKISPTAPFFPMYDFPISPPASMYNFNHLSPTQRGGEEVLTPHLAPASADMSPPGGWGLLPTILNGQSFPNYSLPVVSPQSKASSSTA